MHRKNTLVQTRRIFKASQSKSTKFSIDIATYTPHWWQAIIWKLHYGDDVSGVGELCLVLCLSSLKRCFGLSKFPDYLHQYINVWNSFTFLNKIWRNFFHVGEVTHHQYILSLLVTTISVLLRVECNLRFYPKYCSSWWVQWSLLLL